MDHWPPGGPRFEKELYSMWVNKHWAEPAVAFVVQMMSVSNKANRIGLIWTKGMFSCLWEKCILEQSSSSLISIPASFCWAHSIQQKGLLGAPPPHPLHPPLQFSSFNLGKATFSQAVFKGIRFKVLVVKLRLYLGWGQGLGSAVRG